MLHTKLAKGSSDFIIIADLAAEIWTEHYTRIIGTEQVTYMLDKFQSATAIASQIIQGYQYYQVNIDKVPVGYFSIIKKEDNLFLSKIYVLKKHRGKGVGKFMMEFVFQKAKELGLISISLTVNKNNNDAIEAYEKMGFYNAGPMVTDIGNGFIMDDNKMVKPLS